MELRLGEMLIERGVLDEPQVKAILEQQELTGDPFGVLAERMFDVDPQAVEEAWARRYASYTRSIDPETEVFDERARSLITRRQAWQFRVLPIRFDERELMVATTLSDLRRALRFATNVLGVPSYFVMCEPEALGQALCRRFPLPGMTANSVTSDLGRLLLG